MKIKTEELKKFMQVAGQIKPNPVATNLDSIKIECTGQEIVFTKTNRNIWVKYSYVCQPSVPEVYLINERMLTGICMTATEFEINVDANLDGGTITITKGEDLLKTKLQELAMFPAVQLTTGDRIKIPKPLVEKIKTASKYISNSQLKNSFNYVTVDSDGIFASNLAIVYYYKAQDLPTIFLDQEPLAIIKTSDDLFYWTSESYDFFQTEGFIFGFIKAVTKPIPYLPIISKSGEDFFICDKQDILDFCTLVQYSKKRESIEPKFESISNDILQLNYVDPDFNINILRSIEIVGNAKVNKFRFNINDLELLLKSLPYEKLRFTKLEGGHYGITTDDDPNYKGIIVRLADPVTA